MQEEQAEQWNDAEAWVEHFAEQEGEDGIHDPGLGPPMGPQHPDYMWNDFEQEQEDNSQRDPY